MPAHRNYFELFLGHGAVMLAKRPAPCLNVGSDVDAGVIHWWRLRPESSFVTVLEQDALQILSSHPAVIDPNTLVYLDPPYLRSTRTRLLYPHEFATAEQHRGLLKIAKRARCMVMISGYDSALYRRMLSGWNVDRFRAMTRGGPRIEHTNDDNRGYRRE
jgi:site-specific DNA-adenine methylase